MAYKKKFNPLLKKGLDYIVKDAITSSGGVLMGDLYFPATGFIIEDVNGVLWRFTVGTEGQWISTVSDDIQNGILTELGEYLLTESGDYLIQE
jgi:hypothetical protein